MLTGQGKWLMVTVVATCVILAVSIVILAVLILQRTVAAGSATPAGATAAIDARIDSAIDDAPPAAAVESPRENWPVRSGNPIDWFGPDDYPTKAKRNGIEGTVRFSLAIDSAGHATSCTIVESSGSVVLDEATCKLASARAELKPLPQTGRPPEHMTQNVRWQLAD